MDAAKEEFLRDFGEHYGYPNGPKSVDQIRATEFKRLQLQGHTYINQFPDVVSSFLFRFLISITLFTDLVYLDHAGATLYSDLQMESVFNDLTTNLYANPHSQSDSSSATLDIVKNARQQYRYALGQGAAAIAVDIEGELHPEISGETITTKISPHQVQRRKVAGSLKEEPTGDVYNLFAFPSECNFSGLRFDLDLVKIIKEDSSKILGISSVCQSGQWMVLIDAAKGCATMPPDLSKYPADFVAISFYKLFGYPTGLGALIVRNGTVSASIADIDFIKRREGIEELFEDGTVSFLSIVSIRHGFKILNSLTVSAISRHIASLALYTRKMLLAMRHGNGSSVCILYGHHNSMKLCHEMGPIISFNLKRPDGSWYGYREVEKLASLSGIQLRTGCFCNPGACAKYLGLSHLDLISNTEAGHVCWDDLDIINGKPVGAVRISFGYMSTYEDVKKFVDFVASSFMSPQIHIDHGNQMKAQSAGDAILPTIQDVITDFMGGLTHDREWILKSLTGEILTQKKVPEMGFISTFIDLSQGMLFVESPRCEERLQIRLESDVYGVIEEIELYGQRYEVYSYDNETNSWFSEAIGKTCSLLRYSSFDQDFMLNKIKGAATCRDPKNKLNFANEAQFLLVSEESVSDLNRRLSSDVQKGIYGKVMQVSASRFRPNLVVSGGRPYAEDGWRYIRIGNKYFSQGKILFGILLKHVSIDGEQQKGDFWLHVGQDVHPD
ncbi:hypothetical protein JHK87_023552 [Glycine soja]|nr:hypothetical protein JHK87_023552 [Glycine soja]